MLGLLVVAEDCVGMLNVCEFLKDWLTVNEDAMFDLPLKEANPHDDRGEPVSIELHFDTQVSRAE